MALQSYIVEWEDAEGFEADYVVKAHSASEAWQKAEKALSSRQDLDFVKVFNAELFP